MRRLVALGAVLVLTGCGISTESSPRAVPSESIAPRGPSMPPEVTSGPQEVEIFLVQDNEVAPVPKELPLAPGPNLLLSALLAAPDVQDRNDGYRSVAFAGAFADQRVPPNGIVTVQLPAAEAANEEPASSDQRLAYAQIVLTLTADAAVRGVVFVRDGAQIQVPRADGTQSPQGESVTARDYRSLVQEEEQ